VDAPVDSLLHRAGRAERRRVLAWLLAGGIVTAGTLGLGSESGAAVAAAMGAALALWSVRQVAGIALARRDFNAADTPPRRAFVVLLHDPNPRAIRPLLAVWDERPHEGERLPKPRSVWRCDDELTALETFAGSVEVHEAWIDTGRRSWSKPRWVRADDGIAVPHRRSLFGRWYVHTTLRRERPGRAHLLTLQHPHAEQSGLAREELELGGSLLGSTAGRVVFMAAFVALALWLA
jgi:hypothetical protein